MCVCVGDRKSGEVPESLGTPFALFPGFCSESLFFFSNELLPCSLHVRPSLSPLLFASPAPSIVFCFPMEQRFAADGQM